MFVLPAGSSNGRFTPRVGSPPSPTQTECRLTLPFVTRTLIFVRHGESEANVDHVIANRESNHCLTPLGRDQARQVAGALREANITRIFTSPIMRALQTAEILHLALGAPLTVRSQLREFDCGELEGRGDPEAWEAHAGLFAAWLLRDAPGSRIPGGEDLPAITARVRELLGEVLATPTDGGAMLFVGHGGLYRAALPFILDNIAPAFAYTHHIGHTDVVVAAAGSSGISCSRWGPHAFAP